MDKYFDYEAQKPILENDVINISLNEITGIFAKLVNIVKKKIYNEKIEKEEDNTEYTNDHYDNCTKYELVEVITK